MNNLVRFVDPVERKIARRLLDDILKRGYLLRIWEGEGWALTVPTSDRQTILDALASTGLDTLWIIKPDAVLGPLRKGGITLIWGNGRDLISDWTDCPEIDEIVNPVNDWIETRNF